MTTPLVNHGYVLINTIQVPGRGVQYILYKRDTEELWLQRLDGTLKLLTTGTALGPTGPQGNTGQQGATGATGPGADELSIGIISVGATSIDFSAQYYSVTYNAGPCTIYLPNASINDNGKVLTIADSTGEISNFNRGINVIPAIGQTINNYSDILMKIDSMSLTFIYNNNNWKTI